MTCLRLDAGLTAEGPWRALPAAVEADLVASCQAFLRGAPVRPVEREAVNEDGKRVSVLAWVRTERSLTPEKAGA
jgi:hypothetical protein